MPVSADSQSRPNRHRFVPGGPVSDPPALAGIVDTAGRAAPGPAQGTPPGSRGRPAPAAKPVTTRGRRAEAARSPGPSAAASRSGRLRLTARSRPLLAGWPVFTLARAALAAACWTLLCAALALSANAVWSATLTPVAVSGLVGCFNRATDAECSDTSYLSDASFTHSGPDYSVTALSVGSGGDLALLPCQTISLGIAPRFRGPKLRR